MAVHRVSNISSTAFVNKKATITSVDLCNIPFVDNSMQRTFNDCKNLTSVININDNVNNMTWTFANCINLVNVPSIPNSVTNLFCTFENCISLVNTPVIPNSVTDMYSTFENCTNLIDAPVIPNSVTDMAYTFGCCTNLVNAPIIPNSVTIMDSTFESCTSLISAPEIPDSVISMWNTFCDCTNLTGNINIYSNQISEVYFCFYGTSLNKDVYIPFKYTNGVQSTTYNSFIARGYSTTSRVNGVLLKDITPLLPSKDYQYTVQGDGTAVLTKYIGTSTKVVGPSKVEGDL